MSCAHLKRLLPILSTLLFVVSLPRSMALDEKRILRILKMEAVLGKELIHYTQAAELKLLALKRLTGKLQKLRQETTDIMQETVKNPLSTFHLVKQLQALRQDVEKFTQTMIKTDSDFVDRTTRAFSRKLSTQDTEHEVRLLFYLQDTYGLKAARMANGTLHGNSASNRLDAESCFLLGERACHSGDLYHGIVWLQQALRAIKQEDLRGGQLEEQTLDYLSFAVYTQSKEDNLEMALKLTKRLLKLVPDHERAKKNVRVYKELLRGRSSHTKSRTVTNKRSYTVLAEKVHQRKFEMLCQGKYKKTTARNPKLVCQYARPHPYFYLRPLKEELISKAPDVYVYHDVLTNEEIEDVKREATPLLKPSEVYQQGETELEHDSRRTSFSAWLPEETKIVSKINKKVYACFDKGSHVRIIYESLYNYAVNQLVEQFCYADVKLFYQVSAITGFVTSDLLRGELIQVVKYSPGQEFEPHRDYAENPSIFGGSGNRVATALFYLNDVERNGATIFVKANLTVFPEKGALLYWRNLLQSGGGDSRTAHAGCPVLVGTKWICTKWIHEYGQENLATCGLDPKL